MAQFGSLVFLLGMVGLRCVISPPLVEALLVGDFLWMYGMQNILKFTHV